MYSSGCLCGAGLRFWLSGELDGQSRREAADLLEEHGGRQAAEAGASRFSVVPLVHPACPEADPETLVTLAYLQHCVEADKVGGCPPQRAICSHHHT